MNNEDTYKEELAKVIITVKTDDLFKKAEPIVKNLNLNYMKELNMPVLNEKGVENVVIAVKFLGSLGKAAKESLADDGKINFSDITNFLKPLLSITGFIGSLKELPAELKDTITDEEKAEIIASLKETGMTDEAIVQGLSLAIEIKNYVFDNFINKEKKEVSE